jgi:hypothetical protein
VTFLDADADPVSIEVSDFASEFEVAQSAVLTGIEGLPNLYLTTAANPSTRVTPSGAGFDGVVELRLYPDISDMTLYGTATATLLPNGNYLLTAAHVFTQFAFEAVGAVFHLPGGNTEVFVDTAILGPGWNGNPFNTADIAVAHLVNMAPAEADRFDIYRETDEVSQNLETLGYGRSGTGSQGSVLPAGSKRDGENRIDAFGQALNGSVYLPGTVTPDRHLVFDFDSGNSANDASGFFLGIPNLGLGSLEVSTAPGDSGGPALIDGRIAGVTSFGQGFNGFTDVLSGTNASFGEFAVDTRVSAFASWIDSVVDIIAPTTPTTPDLLQADDTGPINSDNVTRLTTLRFTGSADPNTSITLLDGSTPIATGTSNGSGVWTLTASNLTPGVHNMAARATDLAGNLATSSALSVNVDPVPPRIVDIRLDGTAWTRDAYSFDPIVLSGKQLAPIPT